MSYVDEILQPGEQVRHRTGPHWLVYGPAILLLAAAIVLAIVSYRAQPGTWPGLGLVLAAVIAGGAVVAWFPAFLRRYTTELVATDRRIVYKTGLVRRHTSEMNMDKVESVNVDQSVLGRLFGYGTVEVRGTGGGIEPLRNIADPLAFRNHVTAG
jgi:uncharacterized membrane protein YdbT with pleckstrin-like domain